MQFLDKIHTVFTATLRLEAGRERSFFKEKSEFIVEYNLLEVVNTIFGLRVETRTERALM